MHTNLARPGWHYYTLLFVPRTDRRIRTARARFTKLVNIGVSRMRERVGAQIQGYIFQTE